jgi:hypothetical protein
MAHSTMVLRRRCSHSVCHIRTVLIAALCIITSCNGYFSGSGIRTPYQFAAPAFTTRTRPFTSPAITTRTFRSLTEDDNVQDDSINTNSGGLYQRLLRPASWLPSLKSWRKKAFGKVTLQPKISLQSSKPASSLSTTTTTAINILSDLCAEPEGPRWAVPSNTTDLSGKWTPIVTEEFKKSYDAYLQNCSQSAIFRTIVLSSIGLTREEFQQKGRNLTIIGSNPAGSWKRTLVSSGADFNSSKYEPIHVSIADPDRDLVRVEAWWQDKGTVHKSILRGKPRVRGGIFETLRYLESDNVLVVDSFFHPSNTSKGVGGFRHGFVRWRFDRIIE